MKCINTCDAPLFCTSSWINHPCWLEDLHNSGADHSKRLSSLTVINLRKIPTLSKMQIVVICLLINETNYNAVQADWKIQWMWIYTALVKYLRGYIFTTLSCCTIAQSAPTDDKIYDMNHFKQNLKMFIKSTLMLCV